MTIKTKDSIEYNGERIDRFRFVAEASIRLYAAWNSSDESSASPSLCVENANDLYQALVDVVELWVEADEKDSA